MKVITIGSNVYLGELEEVKGGIVLKDSIAITGEPTRAHLVTYIKAVNTKQLNKPAEIKGANISYIVRPLSDDLALEYDILKLQFAKAEGLALPELVNQKFAALVG